MKLHVGIERRDIEAAGYPSKHAVWRLFPEGLEYVQVEVELLKTPKGDVYRLPGGGCILAKQARPVTPGYFSAPDTRTADFRGFPSYESLPPDQQAQDLIPIEWVPGVGLVDKKVADKKAAIDAVTLSVAEVQARPKEPKSKDLRDFPGSVMVPESDPDQDALDMSMKEAAEEPAQYTGQHVIPERELEGLRALATYPGQAVLIDYKNWRGERGWRRIRPIRLTFASTEWHPTPQWLVVAEDLDKREERSFAMADIYCWSPDNWKPAK